MLESLVQLFIQLLVVGSVTCNKFDYWHMSFDRTVGNQILKNTSGILKFPTYNVFFITFVPYTCTGTSSLSGDYNTKNTNINLNTVALTVVVVPTSNKYHKFPY
jgi:hypothetical protein